MRYTLLSALILPALVGPVLAGDITYKEYAKAPEVWRRGYVSGIAEYMSAVPQPDEAPPYPARNVLKRCLGATTDTVLVRRVEAYVAANPGLSNAPMNTVVLRALFDSCRADISEVKPSTPAASHRDGP
jgi:hypothetical protein